MWMYQIGNTTQTFMSANGNLKFLVNATKNGITQTEYFTNSQDSEMYTLKMRGQGYTCSADIVTKLV